MEKLFFQEHNTINSLIEENKRVILNFMNLHDLYLFKNNSLFKKSTKREEIVNSIDGFIISVWLSIKNLRVIKRYNGPDFTLDFFKTNKMKNEKKHLFLGLENKDLNTLSQKFNIKRKNLFSYNPPYIKDIKFPKKEVDKMIKIINSKKIDFVWVGLGAPKQNILSEELFKKTKARYFFNVGAATDFLLEKKKRAPKLFRKLGIEWLYRLITDFKHSKKKVLRHFLALMYLNSIDIK